MAQAEHKMVISKKTIEDLVILDLLSSIGLEWHINWELQEIYCPDAMSEFIPTGRHQILIKDGEYGDHNLIHSLDGTWLTIHFLGDMIRVNIADPQYSEKVVEFVHKLLPRGVIGNATGFGPVIPRSNRGGAAI